MYAFWGVCRGFSRSCRSLLELVTLFDLDVETVLGLTAVHVVLDTACGLTILKIFVAPLQRIVTGWKNKRDEMKSKASKKKLRKRPDFRKKPVHAIQVEPRRADPSETESATESAAPSVAAASASVSL